MRSATDLPQGVQTVSADAPAEYVIRLLKRDGGVFVKGLVSEADVDKAYDDCREKMDSDGEWEGNFFPKETKRAPSMIALSSTYTYTQVMNPLYRAVCDHFLTTRSMFWWGDERKESVSKPYVHSCVAMRIGPGGKAQPLHRDDYIGHNVHTEITEWDDVRDRNRESAVGLFVAGCKVTPENGGTQFIPGSHLWGNDREEPPKVEQCIFASMEKGDAFIMLASAYHGGGHNRTKDEYRLVFSTFITRGYLRQEENQFLAVPIEKVREYPREVMEYIGYSLSDPACGTYDQMDPIYFVMPELEAKYRDY
ncbi:PhyH-domain-containing protein [Byssothecium circinans]|uniref:PhyH-domain-containing protein n=1 Tax=Byssothecium circinans TaxID=147558 RepID=A0A6A5TLP7_9PLEO|nr:PhyH-domain-containing protein [Byssothecium circinans]